MESGIPISPCQYVMEGVRVPPRSMSPQDWHLLIIKAMGGLRGYHEYLTGFRPLLNLSGTLLRRHTKIFGGLLEDFTARYTSVDLNEIPCRLVAELAWRERHGGSALMTEVFMTIKGDLVMVELTGGDGNYGGRIVLMIGNDVLELLERSHADMGSKTLFGPALQQAILGIWQESCQQISKIQARMSARMTELQERLSRIDY